MGEGSGEGSGEKGGVRTVIVFLLFGNKILQCVFFDREAGAVCFDHF